MIVKTTKWNKPDIFYSVVGLLVFFSLLMVTNEGCRGKNTPKPRGYFRIDFPDKEYQLYDDTCPYTFEYPRYGILVPDDNYLSEPCWVNIEFPQYNGKIHISYKPISGNIGALLEDSHTLAYKHTIKAQAIDESLFLDSAHRVYGMMYDISGDAASAVQFYATDSIAHFLRGSLYFYLQPNSDSLAPVIEFFREDIIHLIETIRWKSFH